MSFYEECINVVKNEFRFKNGKVKIQLVKKDQDMNDSYYNKDPYNQQPAFVLYSSKDNKQTKKFIAEIHIKEDTIYFLEKNPNIYETVKCRFIEFLKYNGFGFNKETHFLICLLHEYGHIDQLNKIYRYNKTLSNKIALDRQNIQSIDLLFNFDEMEDAEANELIRLFDSSELYADNFTFKYFNYIWHKLSKIKIGYF